MARPNGTRLRKVLASVLPQREIERQARAAGVLRRQRKVRVQALFWSLILGFGAGRERTLAGVRRAYEDAAGHTLVASAFYDRFTPAVVKWLRALLAQVIAQTVAQVRLSGPLRSFQDLVLTDSTVIRLHDWLADAFPACRTNHTQAALKPHVVYSVAAAGLRSIKLTAERVHDGPVFKVGKWVQDRLLLFDLGYFRYQLMSCITRNGGFYVVRLKKSADPLIVAVHRSWRGRAVDLVGKRVSEVLPRLRRQEIDVEVEVRFKNRIYAGVRHSARMRLRLVGVRDAHSGEHHLYLTNIAPERLTANEIAQVYAARWIIELLFRQLKGQFRMEELPSRKRAIVEALAYAALIALAVSRELRALIQKRLGKRGDRVPQERWARLFAEAARDLLRSLARRTSALTRALLAGVERTLLHEALDPNAGGLLLLQRVEALEQFKLRYQR
jgi:putative transposase